MIVIKNVIASEDILVHKADRPSNYFFQHFHHNQVQIKKGKMCVQILLKNTPDLNTVESTFKAEQLHAHTCLGHSKLL